METETGIINRVEKSGLITLDLAVYQPEETIVGLDIADFLYERMILKEKDFRDHVSRLDTDVFRDKIAAVYSSEDAIIPLWAWMLVSQKLVTHASVIRMGTPEEVRARLLLENIQSALNPAAFTGKKVVIKGCGDKTIPNEAYLLISTLLVPYVQSLMYGEACSTVPIYKKPKSDS